MYVLQYRQYQDPLIGTEHSFQRSDLNMVVFQIMQYMYILSAYAFSKFPCSHTKFVGIKCLYIEI